MKKKVIWSLVAVLMFTTLVGNAFASSVVIQTDSFQYTDVVTDLSGYYKFFAPKSGTMTVRYSGDPNDATVSTNLSFTMGTNAVNNINNFYMPDDEFFGVDIKTVPDSGSNYRMDATTVGTSLPDPHYDYDYTLAPSWAYEAEVQAMGNLSARQYSFYVNWDDYRYGSSTCSGGFKSNAEMSVESSSGEYNVMKSKGLGTVYFKQYPGYAD